MRFAIPSGALGCLAALLVGCGSGGDKLLDGADAGSLQDALAAVQSACAGGSSARAGLAAQRFADRVAELSDQRVDRRLIANLQQGATTLEAAVPGSCEGTTSTTPETTPTTPTTTTPTTTTTTEPPPTTPETTPTIPTTTVPDVTTPPDNGGGPVGDGTDTTPTTGGGGAASPGATP